MESKHRELLSLHRERFVQEVDDVQHLLPFLQTMLEPHEVHLITANPNPGVQVGALLDVVMSKPAPAFQSLCVGLENTFPHLLTEMFVGPAAAATPSSSNTSSYFMPGPAITTTSSSNNKGGASRYQSVTSESSVTKRNEQHTSPPPPATASSPDPSSQHSSNKHSSPSLPPPPPTPPAKQQHIRPEHAPISHAGGGKHSHRSSAEYTSSPTSPEHVPGAKRSGSSAGSEVKSPGHVGGNGRGWLDYGNLSAPPPLPSSQPPVLHQQQQHREHSQMLQGTSYTLATHSPGSTTHTLATHTPLTSPTHPQPGLRTQLVAAHSPNPSPTLPPPAPHTSSHPHPTHTPSHPAPHTPSHPHPTHTPSHPPPHTPSHPHPTHTPSHPPPHTHSHPPSYITSHPPPPHVPSHPPSYGPSRPPSHSSPSHSPAGGPPVSVPSKNPVALRAAYALVPMQPVQTQRVVSRSIDRDREADLKALREANKAELQKEHVNNRSGSGGAAGPPMHDIDSLKTDCDWAMAEVITMKLQQSETSKKCEQAMKDSEHLRQALKLTKDKNESLESKINLLKAELSDVRSQKQHVEAELIEQRKQREADQEEISELRKQQRDVMSESGSSEVLNMYDSAVDKYKSLHQEFEDMRKRFSDTVAQLTAAKSKVDLLQDENERIRKQNREVIVERNKLIENHKILKQHLTTSIQVTSQEKANAEKELQNTKIERDTFHNKCKVLNSERDAVLHEYSLVMSERNSVHREMETLDNRLEESKRKHEHTEKEKKAQDEELEKLRRDLAMVTLEKERLQKQMGEAHDKYDEMVEVERGKRDSLIKDFDRKLQLETIPHLERDKERTSSERYKDRAARKDSKEIESLKRDIERLQAELADSRQQLEDAKKTRDWVFTEREKIVRERESVKTLCDKMRHERDDAVSSYMEAVKDADELKKQKADTQREMKQIREQYDALREKQLQHSNSNDSAIDSDDMHEQPSHTIHVLLEDVGHDVGFELVGGQDNPLYSNDPSIYISNIRPEGRAYTKLRANDQVVKINNTDVTSVDHMVAVQALKASGNRISLVVRRRKGSGVKTPYLVHLRMNPDEECGLSLEQGLYVHHIRPGSVAAQDHNVSEGDRILSMNGVPADECLPLTNAQQMLRQSHILTMQILKQSLAHPLHTSSSLSSGGNVQLTESSPDALSLSPKSPHHTIHWATEYAANKYEGGLKSSGSQTDSLDSPQPRTRRAPSRTPPAKPTRDESTEQRYIGSHLYEVGSSQLKRRSAHETAAATAHYVASLPPPSSQQYNQQQQQQDTAQSNSTHASQDHGKPPTPHYNTRQHPSSSSSRHDTAGSWGSRQHEQQAPVSAAAAISSSYHSSLSQYPPSSSSYSSLTPSSSHHTTESDPHHHVPSSSAPPHNNSPPSQHTLSLSSSLSPHKERSTEHIINNSSRHSRSYDHKSGAIEKQSPDKEGIFPRFKKAMIRPFAADRQERDSRSKSSVMETFYTASNEQEIIAGLDEILNQHESGHGNKKERRQRNSQLKETAHGGTWPKARPHDGVFKSEKERPPIASAMLGGGESRYQQETRLSKAPPTPPERNDSFKLASTPIKHSPQSSDASACSVKYNPMYAVPSSLPATAKPESPPNSRKRNKQTPTAQVSSTSSYTNVDQKPPAPPTSYSSTNKVAEDQKQKPVTTGGSHSNIIGSNTSSGGFNKHPQRLGSSSSKVSSTEAVMSPDNSVTSVSYRRNAEHRRAARSDRPSSAPSRTHKQKEQKRQVAAMIHGSSSQERHHHHLPPSSLDLQPVFSPVIMPPPPPPPTGYPPHYSQTAAAAGSNRSSLSSFGSLTGPLSPHDQKQLGGPPPPPPHLLRSSNIPYQTAIRGLGSPPTYFPEMPPPPLHQPGEVSGERGAGFNRFSSPSPSPSLQSSSAGGGGHDSITTSDGDFHIPPGFLPPRRPLPLGDRSSSGGRVHLPSNHSIMSSSNASAMSATSSSYEGRLSERSSPTSPFVSPADMQHLTSSSTDSHGLYPTRRPDKGETRNINVEKSTSGEPLGIKIDKGDSGGIFVSSVNDNSLARRAGVQIGDQLLEVCGINLRTATYDDAARILRQCDGSINMLVQYNPNNYQESLAAVSSEESDSDDDEHNNQNGRAGVHKITLSRTPSHRISNDTITPDTATSPSHSKSGSESFPLPSSEPRFVILKNTGSGDNLGLTLIGGNAVGIFVQTVQQNSVASGPNGLRCGDQILEFNGTNFRCVTAEQAALEISRPADSVAILAQYNFAKYTKIHEQPGDALYVRALYEHSGEAGELSFGKNDILFVDDTMYQGQLGMWRAWRVDNQGNKLCCGTVWSKAKLEEDFASRYSTSELGMEEGSRRGSGLARRSFFRRNKKHQRNNSKDSRDLSSISDASLTSDSVPFLDSEGCMMTYERVERLDSTVCRPVLIIGPLYEPLINKLTAESPDKYCRVEPEIVKASLSFLETGQHDGAFVDFKARSDGSFECITVQSVKEIMDKELHCMLSCSPSAIETLHKVHIYPIVLFCKHKSAKQIREAREPKFLPEKMHSKMAKELFDTYGEHEKNYRRYFSDFIDGGNLAFMCYKIKSAINKESKKALWVQSGTL